MPQNDILQHCSHLLHIERLFIYLYHRIEIIHSGIRRIELIVYHIELFSRETVFGRSGQSFFLGDRYTIVILYTLQVQFRYPFRGMSAEDKPRSQTIKTAFADQINRSKRIASQLVEIIMNSHLCKAQNLCHCIADGLLNPVGRGNIAALKIFGIRCRQCTAIQLSVSLHRDRVNLHEIGRNHIIRQSFHQFFTERCRIKFHILCIVDAEVALSLFLKTARCAPFYVQGLLDCGLNFCRLNAIAVYFDHVAIAAKQNIIPVFIDSGKISGVVETVSEGIFCLLRQIDIPADKRIFKT